MRREKDSYSKSTADPESKRSVSTLSGSCTLCNRKTSRQSSIILFLHDPFELGLIGACGVAAAAMISERGCGYLGASETRPVSLGNFNLSCMLSRILWYMRSFLEGT